MGTRETVSYFLKHHRINYRKRPQQLFPIYATHLQHRDGRQLQP